jgi:predicted alpha/beta-hydrolase family hydrolase
MQRWARQLESIGRVQLFDYTYTGEGRRRPDALPELIATHRRALAQARSGSEPVVIIGKSMGGRVGCHVSLEEQVNGLICLGYPLCVGGDVTRLRDKVLRQLQTPVLFVQGTRDPLCTLDLLQSVRREMKARNLLHIVDGGDHSLAVRKCDLVARGETQAEVDAQIVEAIRAFVAEVC